jgi:hypothetical protein
MYESFSVVFIILQIECHSYMVLATGFHCVVFLYLWIQISPFYLALLWFCEEGGHCEGVLKKGVGCFSSVQHFCKSFCSSNITGRIPNYYVGLIIYYDWIQHDMHVKMTVRLINLWSKHNSLNTNFAIDYLVAIWSYFNCQMA